jgi:hypothetical protein
VIRALKALGAVAVVVALVVLGFQVLTRDDSQDPADSPSSQRSARDDVPPPPADAPHVGMYVLSSVAADGTVEVQTWVRTRTPISELRLTTTDPDLLPGSVESLDLKVHEIDGALLAHRDTVGTNPQQIRLRSDATDLYFTYVIDGAMDDASATVETRTLARVLGMDVDYDGAGDGVVRRVVTATGTVLNVACLRPTDDFDESPRPCGEPTGDGDWTVDLRGAHWHDRLLAQVEG